MPRGDAQNPLTAGVNSLSLLAKENEHRLRAMGVLSAVEHFLKETAMHTRAPASSRLARANRASHGPRVRATARVKRTKENPQVPKARTRAKHRKLVSQVLKSETQESAQTCPTDNSWIHDGRGPDDWNDGWNGDDWNDDWRSVGWHESWEQTYDTSASSFSLGAFDLGATSSLYR